jgi:hypothetical protein
MRDKLDEILIAAQRSARNSAFDAAIELCQLVEENGGCAKCCVVQIEQLRREMLASDLAHDALERARHA